MKKVPRGLIDADFHASLISTWNPEGFKIFLVNHIAEICCPKDSPQMRFWVEF